MVTLNPIRRLWRRSTVEAPPHRNRAESEALLQPADAEPQPADSASRPGASRCAGSSSSSRTGAPALKAGATIRATGSSTSYTLVRHLRRTLTGQVWLCHTSWGEQRVLKVSAPATEELLWQEIAKVEAATSNAPTFFEASWGLASAPTPHAPLVIIATEFIEGSSLAELASRGELQEELVALVVHDLCEALSSLHGNRFLHRDVKPANVRVSRSNGRCLLCDFSLSCDQLDSDRASAVVGTPLYMAPEVAIVGSAVDSAVDLWSLGVTATEMLLGPEALDGLDYSGPMAVRERLRAGLSTNPSASMRLRMILGRCLETDPQQRTSAAAILRTPLRVRRGDRESIRQLC